MGISKRGIVMTVKEIILVIGLAIVGIVSISMLVLMLIGYIASKNTEITKDEIHEIDNHE